MQDLQKFLGYSYRTLCVHPPRTNKRLVRNQSNCIATRHHVICIIMSALVCPKEWSRGKNLNGFIIRLYRYIVEQEYRALYG